MPPTINSPRLPVPHYVVGHQNPDTDTVVSAYVSAWLTNQLNPEAQATPVRLGEVNQQTVWLFEQAGTAIPILRKSCLYHAEELAQPVPMLAPHEPLRAALEAMQRAQSGFAAIVDEASLPLGIVSDRSPRTNYLLQCNIEDFIGTLLDFADLIRGLPLERLTSGDTPTIEHLKVPLHADDPWETNTAVIVGNNEPVLDRLKESPPAAVIITEVDLPTAEKMGAELACPVYHFSGSLISMLTRLPGCFPASAAVQEEYVAVEAQTPEDELREQVKAAPSGVLVLDEEGKVLGSVSASHLLNTQRPRVSLVDHSERSQSIAGLQDAEVVEIIDHHRLGDIETIEPLCMDLRPLGSTATILYERIIAAHVSIPPEIAKLLLGALISDTLLLTSPTTTEIDRKTADALTALSGVELQAFGLEVLRSNDEILSGDIQYLVKKDCKQFTFQDIRFLAAQIETVDVSIVDDARVRDLNRAFENEVGSASADFGILMITDVIQGKSLLSIVAQEEKWKETLAPEDDPRTSWTMENFVSRKKQLIPLILNTIRKAMK